MIAPRPLKHREWLCALDINADSERVLELASRGALEAGAKLSLIHILRNNGSRKVDCDEEGKARRSIDELQKKVGSNAGLYVLRGPVKDALLKAARQMPVDVLMIGRPRSGLPEVWADSRTG